MFSRFYRTVLGTNKLLHWKKLLKHLLCYNITTGSDSSEVVVFNNKFVLIKEFREVARNFNQKH